MIPPFCPDPPPTCCESLYDFASAIVTLAGAAVQECLGATCPNFPAYVCHGEPVGGGDYLAGWISAIQPASPPASKGLLVVGHRATMNVALCQDGYPGPIIEGGEIKAIPSAGEHNQASYYSYGLAEVMYRRVLKAVSGCEVACCSPVAFGSLIAETPAMFSARWRFSFTADITLATAPVP